MIKHYLLAVGLVLIPPLSLAQASQAPATARELHKLYEGFTFLGMQFKGTRGNAVGVVPFDRSYEALTKVEQQTVMTAYERMEEGDEPPFPLGGLSKLYDPITQGQQRLLVDGRFVANVQVDSQGNATAVTVLKTPGSKVTQFVSAVALLTKYKPALCKGVPCTMGFPIRVNFKVE